MRMKWRWSAPPGPVGRSQRGHPGHRTKSAWSTWIILIPVTTRENASRTSAYVRRLGDFPRFRKIDFFSRNRRVVFCRRPALSELTDTCEARKSPKCPYIYYTIHIALMSIGANKRRLGDFSASIALRLPIEITFLARDFQPEPEIRLIGLREIAQTPIFKILPYIFIITRSNQYCQ